LNAGQVNWNSYTPEAYREADERAMAELLEKGASTPYEKQYVRADGSRIWVLVSDAIMDREQNEIAAFVIEINERKQAEAELQRVMEELQRSNAELEQFAYVASHDLQEPLRTVAGMVQLLQQRYKDQLDERGEEYIQYAVQGTVRMQALIDDLLLFSRVNRRSNRVERIAICDVLEMALNNLAVSVHESGAVITQDPEMPELFGDGIQLAQVFQNLISNAIKFRGDESPRIHIGAERIDEWIKFSVSDNGIGIEEKYFERIFSPFQRLHTRREYQGNGIGLAICKKIVERYAGRIWVESTPGEGSTFFFTVPIEQKPLDR
jgi:light-regulated signal transduction histidine kinase (bacteriophytochrome)